MTIEEYLKSEIEYSKGMMFEADDIEGKSYFEGMADALDELLRKLPEMEHEVTLKELHQYCDKHREKEGHHGCPFLIEGNPNAEEFKDRFPGCGLTRRYPCGWNVDAIQKLMKEARHE